MKVLHVIPSVGPLRGGPSFVIQTMTRGLAARGCEVHIATTDDNAAERLSVPLGSPVQNHGVTCWYFPRQTRFYLFSWPLFRWLARHVREFDLVHIHALFSFATLSAAYWARHYGVPYVVRPLGTLNRWGIQNRRPWLKQLSLRLIDCRVIAGAAAMHFTSEQEREEAAEVALVPRAAVIPNPVDFQFDRLCAGWLGSHYPAIAGREIVLFLSRLHPKKGIDILLSAFARVRARFPNIALVLVGAGEDRFVEQLHRQAQELKIDSDVVWAGFLEGEAKQSVMAEADIFVLPSYSENFGVAVVEAMAAGLPVVVSDCVGIHREVASAHAGLVVPCREEALSEALLRLLETPELRSEAARNGKRLAESFSPGGVSKRLIELYSQICSSTSTNLCKAQTIAPGR